jgi:propanediol dehydratase small subunit
MNHLVIFLCILAAIFVLTLPIHLRVRRNMRRYWDRACTGFRWRRRFPDAPKAEIREFLDLFVDGFAYPKSHRLCFSPDDRVIDIYCAQYPDKFMADCLEMETFCQLLEERYGVDVTKFGFDGITLGEIYEHTHRVAKITAHNAGWRTQFRFRGQRLLVRRV